MYFLLILIKSTSFPGAENSLSYFPVRKNSPNFPALKKLGDFPGAEKLAEFSRRGKTRRVFPARKN